MDQVPASAGSWLWGLNRGIQEAPSSLNEANHSYEDIFKVGFPEVFVSQSRENIRSLDQVLDTNNEDVGNPECVKNQLCIDSGNIWRTLRDFDNTASLRHPWSKSHCQENLLSVLGIDANEKDFLESQDDIFEESNVKDNEDFRFDGFNINDCKALIQTKFKHVTPCPVTTLPDKQSLSSFPVGPFRYWKTAIRSPWSLVFSRLNNPNSLSLSS
ncbi:hypothetical protein GRJ2_001569400 [Grus japonensis]|uniref:Aftiphilin clathrin-binding box domain-containing protein n=1 Tax=Grus japonensis TaxID=30415 RepID=A0ABC9X0D5_GRUJA